MKNVAYPFLAAVSFTIAACGGVVAPSDAAADGPSHVEVADALGDTSGSEPSHKCYVPEDPLKSFACDAEADCSNCPDACAVEGFDAAGVCK